MKNIESPIKKTKKIRAGDRKSITFEKFIPKNDNCKSASCPKPIPSAYYRLTPQLIIEMQTIFSSPKIKKKLKIRYIGKISPKPIDWTIIATWPCGLEQAHRAAK